MDIKQAKEIIGKFENNPLVIVDKIIQFFRGSINDYNSSLMLDLLAQKICQYLNIKPEEYKKNPVDYLFKKNLEFKDRRFISICLLRVFTYNRNLFGGDSFYHRTIELFDDIFKKNLYAWLSIDLKKDESYEKLSKLTSFVNELENELNNSILSLSSLDAIEEFKKRYEHVLNNKHEFNFMLSAFIPKEYLNIKLSEIFNMLSKFLTANKEEFFIIYNETIESFDNYINHIKKEYATYYMEKYIAGLIEKLKILISREFKKNPICQPAKLIIEKGDKKYPFHHLNELIDLNFIIKNLGPGHAYEISIELDQFTDLEIIEKNRFLSYLEKDFTTIEIPATIKQVCKDVIVAGKCRWQDYSNNSNELLFEFLLEGQNPDINWAEIENKKPEPYSLKPISNEENLVGRKEILRHLKAHTKAKEGVGSYIIWGQRRVGKTSLVQALANVLSKENDKNFKVIYLRSGDFSVADDPKETINYLIRGIYKDIILDLRFKNISLPDLIGSFSTISSFLKDVINVEPNFRILFIIDDFDYLPSSLFRASQFSESFFNTIKARSSDNNFGFILVGGERMEDLNKIHGDKVNLFKWIAVDYFSKEQWEDYRDLVTRPVSSYKFEFTEDSIFCLYRYTSGNPYFTNLICQNLFSIMLSRRDCHITRREVELALRETIINEKGSSFAHFWEDGILDSDEISKIKEMNKRRKFLVTFARALRQSNIVSFNLLLEDMDKLNNTIDIKNINDNFIKRKIIIENRDIDNNVTYFFRVPLFCEWLKERGPLELSDAFSDSELEYKNLIIKEEEERITSSEIIELVDKWDSFKNQKITEDRLRCWIEQFKNNYHQRLILKLLQRVKFYSVPIIREKMEEAHTIVTRKLHKERGTWKKNEIIVSYIGKYGKSSSRYAHIYKDENNIPNANIIEYSKIADLIKSTAEIKAIVFIDDFIGTGEQGKGYLEKINEEYGKIFIERDLLIFYIVIAGFQKALSEIDDLLPRFNFINFHILETLEETDRCFSRNSNIFSNDTEIDHARSIIEEKGKELAKNIPLGYGNCQALVVFSDSCPNNTLPILWAKSKTWVPLFRRY